jgi:hypothetical protein
VRRKKERGKKERRQAGPGCQREGERREDARAARLGLGDCWAAGKRERRATWREKREEWEMGRQGKGPAQEGGGGRDGLRVRREGKRDGLPGWADFFSLISFSFLFQLTQFYLNSNLTIQTNKRDAPA